MCRTDNSKSSTDKSQVEQEEKWYVEIEMGLTDTSEVLEIPRPPTSNRTPAHTQEQRATTTSDKMCGD